MNLYEEIVKEMRTAGMFYNEPPLQIGIVGENGSITVDSLILDKDDYLIDCNLRLDDKEKRFYHTNKVPAETNLVAAHNDTLKEYRDNLLKEGDQVIVYKIEDQYVILAKVVSAE